MLPASQYEIPKWISLSGQMQDPEAIPILKKVLENEKEDPVVRHEVGGST